MDGTPLAPGAGGGDCRENVRDLESSTPPPACHVDKNSMTVASPFFAFPGHQGNRLFELFICSESGKPVYFYNKCRDDEFVVTLTGLIQALVNFFSDALSDDLKTITSLNGVRITFAVKSPLILMLVTHVTSSIDPVLVINQVNAEIVSILTFKTLTSVFQQKPTYDLRRLLGGSEKLLDTLIDEGLLKNQLCMRRKIRYQPVSEEDRPPLAMIHGYLTSYPAATSTTSIAANLKGGNPLQQSQQSIMSPTTSSSSALFSQRSFTSRSLIPVLPLNPATRESITNAVAASVLSTTSSVLFALLFLRRISRTTSSLLPGTDSILIRETSNDVDLDSTLLITIHNNSPKQAKLNPLDVQLLSTLVIASEGQLSSAESLWLPVCIPRVDPSAFIHGHISYIQSNSSSSSSSSSPGSSPGSPEDSRVQEKLCLLLLTVDREDFNRCQHIRDTLTERLNKVRITPAPFGELNSPQLDMFCFLSIKPHCIVYRNLPCVASTQFHPLMTWLSTRMTTSGYKTFWYSSLDHSVCLLGWHSPTFVLYFQFDSCITHGEALAAASQVVKWVKKEEDKIKLKDYQ